MRDGQESHEEKKEVMNLKGPFVKKAPTSWGCTYTPGRIFELTESLIEWIEDQIKGEKLFLFADWAFENKVNPKHLAYIATKSDNFKEAYLLAKAYQEHILCKGSLYKQLDGGFSKFMLVNHHDYTSNPDKDKDSELGNDFGNFMNHIRKIKNDNGTEGTIPKTDSCTQ